MIMHELITILGPTASGKTGLAAALAARIDGEVISADSRQVYRGMDLGTGKDLDDYIVNGERVPYHLIDIADPGEEYNVFRFQQDFLKAYNDIRERGKKAIMCGGTGMYLESVILGYRMSDVSQNEDLRKELELLTDDELNARLRSLRDVHNVTDTTDRKRLIRAIEISSSPVPEPVLSLSKGSPHHIDLQNANHKVFGISLPREEVRKRITRRLKQRLDEGMVEEVKTLLASGLSPEQLEFYGLEYKYLTQYATGKINYDDMFQGLNTAIHQFAKRQMTWFRRMEKKGVEIVWIDGNLELPERLYNIRNPIFDI
ncbi:MAG: tRNA (adenosine(37)-N6)-dimethylallyltransferase MiaA [Bacteroidales bacterium]|nr:tRNA (adenosine(37)-N6)-dimethylallyltransferase MiaA [Bacteroidales bacterium]